ncbi:E3 ubiquitin-protein ligase SH3RF1-like [Aplysia californica]|uniref:E3 ubiquitin-protein ligase SH3RF1-like n=1 Tax=Aplysia californica TaxID=6500 RepID=A0ABM0K9K9_APLCA|nr:E3 ubiquitin-protein ligase SH3RF1-like [Aplysia californica]
MDEKQINELLECSVCLERLDQTCKVLPCQHTFCRRCLEEILLTNRELCCPECRAVVTVRVADLPTNILVVRILEGLKTKNQRIGGGGVRLQGPGSLSSSPSKMGRSSPLHRLDAQSIQLLRQGSQPCAKALYNYESSEKDDLIFKRGDLILLRRQVDENWFQGELCGKVGFFPANFVQVLVPLPQVPQCRALYDFDLKDENEKDCLSFKKDEVLTVIRRVDENWLEGRKGDKIGIFPLTFVELNDSARSLINSKSNLSILPSSWPSSSTSNVNSSSSSVGAVTASSLTSSSSLSPPLPPPTSSSSLSAPATSTSTSSPSPAVPVSSIGVASVSSSSSLTATQALPQPIAQTSALSPAVSATSSSPPQNKRHSFTSPSSTAVTEPGGQSQRHSAEVTVDSGGQLSVTSSPPTSVSPPAASETQSSSTDAPAAMSSQAHGVESSEAVASTSTSAAGVQSGSLTTPVYTALYNYKPQKEDELELHKGDHYTVSEKCQDGWFKGASVRSGQAGVFPGNYVHMVRHSSAFKPVNPNVLNIRAKGPSPALASSAASAEQKPSSASVEAAGSQQAAPPLMPRVARMTSSGQKSRSGCCQSSASPTRCPNHGLSGSPAHRHQSSSSPCSFSTAAPPVPGHPNSSRPLPSTVVPAPPAGSCAGSPHRSAWVSPAHLSASAHITPPNVALAHSVDTASTSRDKKEKKEKGVKGLGKLLSGKSKKMKPTPAEPEATPPPSVLCFDNVAHVRSGSFPVDSSAHAAGDAGPVSAHRKAASLDATPTPPIPAKPRPKPPMRERFCCIVPYPPQTEHELSLEVGDIIHVHRKRDDGWYKGTQERTGRTGMFPASFVEKCD